MQPLKKSGSTLQSPAGAKHGWSAERRAKHAAAIRKWKPWAKSTGPRTKSGKAASARNAFKHGGRAAPVRALTRALCAQRRYLHMVNLYAALKAKNPANELLDGLEKRLVILGKKISHRLLDALKQDIRDTYRHKLDLSLPSGTLLQQYV